MVGILFWILFCWFYLAVFGTASSACCPARSSKGLPKWTTWSWIILAENHRKSMKLWIWTYWIIKKAKLTEKWWKVFPDCFWTWWIKQAKVFWNSVCDVDVKFALLLLLLLDVVNLCSAHAGMHVKFCPNRKSLKSIQAAAQHNTKLQSLSHLPLTTKYSLVSHVTARFALSLPQAFLQPQKGESWKI